MSDKRPPLGASLRLDAANKQPEREVVQMFDKLFKVTDTGGSRFSKAKITAWVGIAVSAAAAFGYEVAPELQEQVIGILVFLLGLFIRDGID